jgi:hypothetical protein
MPDEDLFGKAFLAAAGSAALVVLLLTFPRANNSTWKLQGAWILSLGLGFGFGFAIISTQLHDSLNWPPRDARERLLLWILPALGVIELLAAVPRLHSWLVWSLRLVLAASLAPVLLVGGREMTTDWSTGQMLGNLGGLGLGLGILWILLAILWQRTQARTLLFALALACIATGVTVMSSGYLMGGWPALPLGGAIAGAALLAPLGPQTGRALAPIGLALVSLFGIVIMGHFSAELPTTSALLLLASPLLAWLPELVPLPRTTNFAGNYRAALVSWLLNFVKGGVRVGLIGLVVGGIAFQAVTKSQENDKPIAAPVQEVDEAEANAYRNFGK